MIKNLSPSALKTIGNAGWLMTDRIVRMGFGLVVGVWLARYLGPVQIGSLNFATSLIALLGMVTTLGLDGILVRQIVNDVSQASETLGTALALRVWTSLALCLLVAIICALMRTRDPIAALLVSVLSLSLVFQAFDVIDCYFQSQVQSKITVIAKVSAFLMTTAARLVMIVLRAPLWAFAVTYVVEVALGAVGMAIGYRWSGGAFRSWTARKGRAVELLKQSWPVLFSGMAIMVYMRIDIVMLEVMQGDRAVGIYATATKISEVWYFVSSAIVTSVSPSIIRLVASPEIYYERIQKLFSMMSLLSVLVGSCMAFGAHFIIHVLYTDAFAAAAPVLAVHVWASIFVFLGVAQTPWDLSQNLLKLSFYRSLTGAVANILLNLVLIPRYSAMGAAVATIASYGISSVVANAFDIRTRPIFYMQLRSLYLSKLWSLKSF